MISSGSRNFGEGGPRNMNYKPPCSAAIFLLAYFYKAGGHGPLAPPPGSATDDWLTLNLHVDWKAWTLLRKKFRTWKMFSSHTTRKQKGDRYFTYKVPHEVGQQQALHFKRSMPKNNACIRCPIINHVYFAPPPQMKIVCMWYLLHKSYIALKFYA